MRVSWGEDFKKDGELQGSKKLCFKKKSSEVKEKENEGRFF